MAGLMHACKRQLRDIQTHAPWLIDAKFRFYNAGTRLAGLFVDSEFPLLAKLPPVGLAIDIGGNRGQSIMALQRYAKPERIVSFEPNAALAPALAVQFRNQSEVTIEAFALGASPGAFDLCIPSYRDFVYDGLASLHEHEAVDFLNPATVARFDPKLFSITRHRVEVRTLDSYGFAPDIIKIDVQGFEEAVLLGGIETVRRAQPLMIVEAPGVGFVKLAATAGLAPFRLADGKLIPGYQYAKNIVFLSDNHRDIFGI